MPSMMTLLVNNSLNRTAAERLRFRRRRVAAAGYFKR